MTEKVVSSWSQWVPRIQYGRQEVLALSCPLSRPLLYDGINLLAEYVIGAAHVVVSCARYPFKDFPARALQGRNKQASYGRERAVQVHLQGLDGVSVQPEKSGHLIVISDISVVFFDRFRVRGSFGEAELDSKGGLSYHVDHHMDGEIGEGDIFAVLRCWVRESRREIALWGWERRGERAGRGGWWRFSWMSTSSPCRKNIASHQSCMQHTRYQVCWDLGWINSPTSTRRGDGFEYIRIWTTPFKKLVFWDDTQVQ